MLFLKFSTIESYPNQELHFDYQREIDNLCSTSMTTLNGLQLINAPSLDAKFCLHKLDLKNVESCLGLC